MKTKFKKNGRRLLAAILCLVMAVMALPMSAFAWTSEEGVSCTSSFGDYYVGSDGEYYRSKSSYSFIVYDSDGNTSVRTIFGRQFAKIGAVFAVLGYIAVPRIKVNARLYAVNLVRSAAVSHQVFALGVACAD